MQKRIRIGFTLIELLVVIAIIALLISIILPSLSAAKQSGISTKCLAQLRVLGQGMVIYGQGNNDTTLPGRMPRIDDCNWYVDLMGGRKYRPTFLAMVGSAMGLRAFDDPQPCRGTPDAFGEPADQQNYGFPGFVCPSRADWTDERSGSYGYNYQFVGNSRLLDANDMFSFKNWPVVTTRLRDTARTVAIADCMGTAATFAAADRHPYDNNDRNDDHRLGNEGFNLDPPRIDQSNGESAGFPSDRSAADPRHLNKANVVWVDGHAGPISMLDLGYHIDADGAVLWDGNNSLWSGKGQDVAWTPGYSY